MSGHGFGLRVQNAANDENCVQTAALLKVREKINDLAFLGRDVVVFGIGAYKLQLRRKHYNQSHARRGNFA